MQVFSVREGPSVDGEHVALDLVAQLSLQVAQLLLQDSQRRHDDGLRPQRAARLHVVEEPEGEYPESTLDARIIFFLF